MKAYFVVLKLGNKFDAWLANQHEQEVQIYYTRGRGKEKNTLQNVDIFDCRRSIISGYMGGRETPPSLAGSRRLRIILTTVA
jgi:hypothetical protein